MKSWHIGAACVVLFLGIIVASLVGARADTYTTPRSISPRTQVTNNLKMTRLPTVVVHPDITEETP